MVVAVAVAVAVAVIMSVFMIMCMTVVMIMVVVVVVLMIVPVAVPVSVIMVVYVAVPVVMSGKPDCYFCSGYTVSLIPFNQQFPPGEIQFLQFPDKKVLVNSQVNHCSEVHISAYSRETIIIQYFHLLKVFLYGTTIKIA
jgi:hypothetical protein